MGGLGKNVSGDSYSFLSAHSEEFPLISSFPLSLFLLHPLIGRPQPFMDSEGGIQ